MAEWSKALKAIVCKYRGFESLFARKLNRFNDLKKALKRRKKALENA